MCDDARVRNAVCAVCLCKVRGPRDVEGERRGKGERGREREREGEREGNRGEGSGSEKFQEACMMM
jgi:hypothetical protein